MYGSAGYGFELKARASARSMPFTSAPRLPLGGDRLPVVTAREQERDARRGYQAAIAAMIESLRHAEQRFDESSAAIDVHIQRALAAVSLTASLGGARRGRREADLVAVTVATAGVALAWGPWLSQR